MERVQRCWLEYFLFIERVRERYRGTVEKRERAISEEIAAHCDTEQAPLTRARKMERAKEGKVRKILHLRD